MTCILRAAQQGVTVFLFVGVVACSGGASTPSVQGPKGDTGPQGSQGIQGPKGDPGAPGMSPVVTAHTPLALDSSGNLTIPTADAADAGVLSPTDWQAFHAKLDSLGTGTAIDIGGTARSPTVSVHFGSGGAVADGDPRLSDARAPTAGSGNYIQNAPGSAQNANINITGSATIGGNFAFSGTLTGSGAGLTSVPDSALSGNVALTSADINLKGHKVTNLAAPIASSDAANKAYVDASAGGRPVVTQISPVGGREGGGTSITVTGANFAGPASVTIGGVAATAVTVVNPTTITATTGANSGGAKDVFVTNADGRLDALPRGYWYGGRRYYRIILQGGASGATTMQLAELNLYDDFAGQWIEPAMTSPTSPAPYVVTATPTTFTASAAWRVFDGIYPTSSYNDGFMSSAGNSFVQIDLGGPHKITKYRIWTSTYSDSGGTYRPTNWQLDASADGSVWTTIDIRSIAPSSVPGGGFIEFPAIAL